MPGTNNRLARLREAEGLTRRDLANGLSPQPRGRKLTERTIYRWEVGEIAIPDPRKAELAQIFGVSMTYLLGWDDAA